MYCYNTLLDSDEFSGFLESQRLNLSKLVGDIAHVASQEYPREGGVGNRGLPDGVDHRVERHVARFGEFHHQLR